MSVGRRSNGRDLIVICSKLSAVHCLLFSYYLVLVSLLGIPVLSTILREFCISVVLSCTILVFPSFDVSSGHFFG